MGYELPVAPCAFCRGEYTYGLYGNPQTVSGIETRRNCERCGADVCGNCAETWESPSEVIRKLCPKCLGELSEDQIEIFKGNTDIRIRGRETLNCRVCRIGFDAEYFGNPNKKRLGDYPGSECGICGFPICDKKSCAPINFTVESREDGGEVPGTATPKRVKVCVSCKKKLPRAREEEVVSGNLDELDELRLEYCRKDLEEYYRLKNGGLLGIIKSILGSMFRSR